MRFYLLPLFLLSTAHAAIEMEPTGLTCNSAVKLTHVSTGFHLTSSEVR